MKVTANKSQIKFLSLDKKFKAFVGGYGSGKTWVGCLEILKNAWMMPNMNQGYFAPTYSHIRDIFFPTMEECAEDMGLTVSIKEGVKEVSIYAGRELRSLVVCRSLDRPQTIVGFKIAHALIDELDILPTDKAEMAWRKIIARMRYKGADNRINVTTTPEGFRFTYRQFKQQTKESYGLVHASTYDNAHNLPEDYITSLIETYPEHLIDAYINGLFVNLNAGTVYRSYNREKCNSDAVYQDGEDLFVGMDFNVLKMAAVVFVKRGNGYHAVAEFKDIYDTPDMIQIIKERYPHNRMFVYPDASGGSRKTVDASGSDIALLRQARFIVRVKHSNPMIRDRVMSVNKGFEAGRLFVNYHSCPRVADCLEQQSYGRNGEPDKSAGHDHMNDAFGYFVNYEMPVIKPTTTTFSIRAN